MNTLYTPRPADFDRGQLLDELSRTRERFDAHPEDPELRLLYAWLLHEAGDFDQATSTVGPLAEEAGSEPRARLLLARLHYLARRYTEAERLYSALTLSEDAEVRAKARAGLALTYFQTDQYARGAALRDALVDPLGDSPGLEHLSTLMGAFGGTSPYRIEWSGARETSIPFHMTDPLPLVPVTVNGRQIDMLIDTGGSNLFVDTEIAEELKITKLGEQIGIFGGGKQAPYETARVSEVRLGDVVIRDVPSYLIPTQRWSMLSPGRVIGGIVTTRVLMQFLATIDYPKGRLVLRDKAASAPALHAMRSGALADIPFHMAGTHHMMVHGSLNGRGELLYFVDSGLASSAAFSAPIQTLKLLGIPVPVTRIEPGAEGGGGGAYPTGTFPIESLGLGPLLQGNLLGDYGSRMPDSYWGLGFIEDGLISHNFLKQYAWTLDFVNTKMLFGR